MNDEKESVQPDETLSAPLGTLDEDALYAAELAELDNLTPEQLAELDAQIGGQDLYAGIEEYRDQDNDLLTGVTPDDDVTEEDLDAQLADYLDLSELADLDLDADPVDVDDEWRDAELEKLIIGEGGSSSGSGKYLFIAMSVLGLGLLGWAAFAPTPVSEAERLAALPPLPELDPEPPPPPPPPPPPKPSLDLFEVQTDFDGNKLISYTIQSHDDLQTIGEKLHDVTGVPRPVTYLAVEDAYWRKYFSYAKQNAEVVSPEHVAGHIGETIKIPVPIPEFPDFDLARLVEEYNQPPAPAPPTASN
ncbi:MAG: hypothetical protein ACE5IK_11925 [Acidobacteriota bacterium]